MPSTLLRLAVALLSFGLGVSATTLWLAYRAPEVKSLKAEPARKKECNARPYRPVADELPLAFPDEPPPPPQPLLPRLPVSGGILNGKAISKPQPAYPSAARAARAGGMVTVRVTVDESGRVIESEPVSGHPLLRQAAQEAASRWRFAPTRLSGQFVPVSGVVSFYFELP